MSRPLPPHIRDIAHNPGLFYHVSGRPGQNDRPPLPPGHSVSWGLLTRGTILEGAEYPFPVFET